MDEGETPTPALSGVALGYVPWLAATVSSPFSSVELSNRIADRIDHRVGWEPGVVFTGSTWPGAFEIRRRRPHKFIFAAWLSGLVWDSPTGSHIRLRLTPTPSGILSLTLWTAACVAGTVVLVMERYPLRALYPVGMGVLMWTFFVAAYRRDGRHLVKMLEEACAITVLPRPKPPKTF